MKSHLKIQDSSKSISVNTNILFHPQNDLKYEVFHNVFAPSSRVKSKAEIENQITHF